MNNICRRLLMFVILVFFSCNDNRVINIPSGSSTTLHRFEDASAILSSWPAENKIIAHIISEPDNLHPTNGNSAPRSEILFYTQRTLLYFDYSSQQIVPGLVKSLPEISADGLQYKYILRDNIKWDDGSLLTGSDIEFTAKAFSCPLTNDPSVRFYWSNIDHIVTDSSNPLEFKIVMKKKQIQNTTFLTGFSILQRKFHDPGNILASYSLQQFNDTTFQPSDHSDLKDWANGFNDDSNGRNPQKLNGLGMYRVTQWETGQFLIIERKKNHWSQQSNDYHEVSYPEKIIFKLNKDEASQVLEFRSQSMDVSTNISMNAYQQLKTNNELQKNYNLELLSTYNYTYICFNEKPDGKNRKKLFDDVRVRRAIAKLTPVENMIRLVYKQYAGQCHRAVSNVSPMKNDFNSELKPILPDLKSAEKLLALAGWSDSDGDGILDKIIDGKKVALTAEINYMTTSTDWKDMAILFKEEMAKAGILINPVAMDLKLFIERAKAHDFDLMLGGWGGSGIPEDYTQLWHTSSWTNHGSNYSGFGNETSDALIDSIKYELNDSIRYSLSHRLQQLIYDDQPLVFLFSNLRRNIIHKRFANQMLFSERPGILLNMMRMLSINKAITMTDEVTP